MYSDFIFKLQNATDDGVSVAIVPEINEEISESVPAPKVIEEPPEIEAPQDIEEHQASQIFESVPPIENDVEDEVPNILNEGQEINKPKIEHAQVFTQSTDDLDFISKLAEKTQIAEQKQQERVLRYQEHIKEQETKKQQFLLQRLISKKSKKTKKEDISNEDKLAYAKQQLKDKQFTISETTIKQIDNVTTSCYAKFSLPVGAIDLKYPCVAPPEFVVPTIVPSPLKTVEWYLKSPTEAYANCELQGSTSYQFIFHKEIQVYSSKANDTPQTLKKDFIYQHETNSIQITTIWPENTFVTTPIFCIVISFSQEPNIDDFLRFISCSSNSKLGKLFTFRKATDNEFKDFRDHHAGFYYGEVPVINKSSIPFIITTTVPFNTCLTLQIKPGWKPLHGNIEAKKVYSDYQIHIGEQLNATLVGHGLSIYFNHHLFTYDSHEINKFHFHEYAIISPAPPNGYWEIYSPTTIHWKIENENEEFEKSTYYTITILEGFKSSINPQFHAVKNIVLKYIEKLELIYRTPTSNTENGIFTPIILYFNQAINRESVLEAASLFEKRRIKSDKQIPLQLGDIENYLNRPNIANTIDRYHLHVNQIVLLRPSEEGITFNYNSKYYWKIEGNVFSLHGPEPCYLHEENQFETTPKAFHAELQKFNKTDKLRLIQINQRISFLSLNIYPNPDHINWYEYSNYSNGILIHLDKLPSNTEYTVQFSQNPICILADNDPILSPFSTVFNGLMNDIVQIYVEIDNQSHISTFPQFIVQFTCNIDADLFKNLVFIHSDIEMKTITSEDQWFPLVQDKIDNIRIDNKMQKILVFQPKKALPWDTDVTLEFKAIPSSEGPIHSDGRQYKYHTSPKLQIISSLLEQDKKQIKIQFNQPICQFPIRRPYQVIHQDGSIKNEYRPTIFPSMEGEWKLYQSERSCQTIIFHSVNDFPNATHFNITFHEGFGVANGNCLTQGEKISLQTAIPKIISHFPFASKLILSTKPIFVLEFNMAIHCNEMEKLCSIRSLNNNNEIYNLHFATEEEINQNSRIKQMIHTLKENHFVVLTTNDNLPIKSSFECHIKQGISSYSDSENVNFNNLTSNQSYSFTFKTDNLFTVESAKVSSFDDIESCFVIQFSNSLHENQNLLENHPSISPQMEGEWKMNNSSLLYITKDKIPKSSEFIVTIPKTIQSNDGNLLPRSFHMTIYSDLPICKLIRPHTISSSANDNQIGIFPEFILQFNQQVDIKSIIKCTQLKFASKIKITSKTIGFRSPTELELEELFPNLQFEEGKYDYPLLPTKILPENTEIIFKLRDGIQSLEGKIVSKELLSIPLKTYSDLPFTSTNLKLKIIKAPNPFLDGNTIIFTFSNQIKPLSIIRYSPNENYSIFPSFLGSKVKIQIQSNKLSYAKDETIQFDLSGVRSISNSALPKKEQKFSIQVFANTFTCGLQAFEDNEFIIRPRLDHSNHSNHENYNFSFRSYNYREIRVVLLQLNPLKDLIKWKKQKQRASNGLIQYNDFISNCGGKKIYDQTQLITNYEKDKEITTTLNLYSLLLNKNNNIDINNNYNYGNVGIIILPTQRSHFPNTDEFLNPIISWIQFTSIGIEVFDDVNDKMWLWCTDLNHLHGPISNVCCSVIDEIDGKFIVKKQMINELGLLQLSGLQGVRDYSIIVHSPSSNSLDHDIAFIHSIEHQDITNYDCFPKENEFLWHTVSDRGCYNPKENLILHGYIRKRNLIENIENLSIPENLLQNTNMKIICEIVDSKKEKIHEINEIKINSFGSFNISIFINESSNLGCTEAIFKLIEFGEINNKHFEKILSKNSVFFQIQEFQIPQFKILTEIKTNHQIYYNGKATLHGKALYYAGGVVSDCQVKWKVIAKKATQSQIITENPFSYFHFTSLTGNEIYADCLETETNEIGESNMDILFSGSLKYPVPIFIESSFECLDLTDQTLNPSNLSFYVFPSNLLIGLYSKQYPKINFYHNNSIEIELILIDCETKQLKENIPIEVFIEKRFSNISSIKEEVIKFTSSSEKPIEFKIILNSIEINEVIITAVSINEKTNEYLSSCELKIAVEYNYVPKSQENDNNDHLITNYSIPVYKNKSMQTFIAKHTPCNENGVFPVYSNICVQFKVAECQNVSLGLVVFYCNGISNIYCLSSAEKLNNENNSILSSSIVFTEPKHIPNMYLKSFIHGIDTNNNKTTWNGDYSLSISPDFYKLFIQMNLNQQIIEPNGSVILDLSICDYLSKKPISNAEIAIFVVDEATLDLLNYSPFKNSIIDLFYPNRELELQADILGYSSNRDLIEYFDINQEILPLEVHKTFGVPGSRIITPIPKIKDPRQKNASYGSYIELLDTAGTEQL